MNLWKKIKNLLRKLAGRDLSKATEEPPFEWVSPKQPPLKEPKIILKANETSYAPTDFRFERPLPTKTLEEKLREEWLPKPTTKRRTRDKSHRPPAANHNIGKHMKGKSHGQSKDYRKSTKAHLGVKEEEND